MISTQHSPTGLRIIPGQTGVMVYSPYLPIWFHRFRTAKEPDPDLKVDPSDINYPSELRCPTVTVSVLIPSVIVEQRSNIPI